MRSVPAGAGRSARASAAVAGASAGDVASAGSASGDVTAAVGSVGGDGAATTGGGSACGGGRGNWAVRGGGVRSTIGADRVAGPVWAQDNAPAATNAASTVRDPTRAAQRRAESQRKGMDTMSEGVDATAETGDQGATPGGRAMPSSLYVVATPLGNAADLTFRALAILRSADLVAAEDTRVTAPFLKRYGIAATLVSLHAHNEAQRSRTVIEALTAGRSVALVSDAGTPAISDPGARLVRDVHAAGYAVVPIPGPSAVAAAVSAAGLAAERFAFLGFLPTQAKARRILLETVAPLPFALVVYEAPHRVRATVAALAEALGGARPLVVARELTKVFETVARMPLSDAGAWFDGDPNRVRGEFVLVVDAPDAPVTGEEVLPPEADRWLRALLAELPPARAARAAAAATGFARDALYARALALRPPQAED